MQVVFHFIMNNYGKFLVSWRLQRQSFKIYGIKHHSQTCKGSGFPFNETHSVTDKSYRVIHYWGRHPGTAVRMQKTGLNRRGSQPLRGSLKNTSIQRTPKFSEVSVPNLWNACIVTTPQHTLHLLLILD